MLIYIFLFVMLAFFSCSEKKQKLYKLAIAIIFVFCAFRGANVDRDHLNYMDLIQISANDLSYPIEIAFKIISYISVNIFKSTLIVFVFFAFLAMYFKSGFISRLSPYPMLSLLVYYSNTYIVHEMTQIRIGVAGGISLYALIALSESKKLKFIFIIALASAFHITALLFLLLLLFDKKNITSHFIFRYFLLLILSYICYSYNINMVNLISYIDISYIQNKYIEYRTQVDSPDFVPINVFSTFQIIHLCIVVLSFAIAKRNKLDAGVILVIKMYSIAPVALALFSFMPVFALRLSELFIIPEIVLLPILINFIKPQYLAKFIIIIICFLIFYINIFHVGLLKDYTLLY